MTALFHAGDGPGCSSGRSPGLVPLRPAGRPARGGRMLLSTRWPEEEGPITRTRSTRRTFLGGLTAAVVSVPALLRAQPRTVKIGMINPVSGPMADVGQDQRLGAQLAVEAINAAGGGESLRGARRALLTAGRQPQAGRAPPAPHPPV